MNFVKIFILSILIVLCETAFSKTAFGSDVSIVQANLTQKFPKAQFFNLQKINNTNLYQFRVAGQIAYTDQQADYILVGGELLLNKDGKVYDYTQSTISNLRTQAFNDLPKNLAIKTVFGNGERTFAMFEDPNCPYCQKFENVLTQNKDSVDATVYTYMFPLTELHPSAKLHSLYFFCDQTNPAKSWNSWMNYAFNNQNEGVDVAWNDWLLTQKVPVAWINWMSYFVKIEEKNPNILNVHSSTVKNSPTMSLDKAFNSWSLQNPQYKTCSNSLETVNATLKLGRSFGFNGTPTLLFTNGTSIRAWLTMDQLNQALTGKVK